MLPSEHTQAYWDTVPTVGLCGASRGLLDRTTCHILGHRKGMRQAYDSVGAVCARISTDGFRYDSLNDISPTLNAQHACMSVSASVSALVYSSSRTKRVWYG